MIRTGMTLLGKVMDLVDTVRKDNHTCEAQPEPIVERNGLLIGKCWTCGEDVFIGRLTPSTGVLADSMIKRSERIENAARSLLRELNRANKPCVACRAELGHYSKCPILKLETALDPR